jgi:3',5'-cyclic AMP phosphodiesterase CpdA
VTNVPRLHISRRQAFAVGARTILASSLPGALCLGGLAKGAPWRAEQFRFLVVNDLHVMGPSCAAWLGHMARHLRAQLDDVDFCLALGDLAHDGTPEQLLLARRALDGFGMPVYTVIGNHDHMHPNGRKTYEQLFPRRINYHFDHKGWQFVGLDSTLGPMWERPFPVQPHSMHWLETTLPQLDRSKPTVLFTHFPLGPGVSCQSTNAREVLGLFSGHNLTNAFSGHVHRRTQRRLEGVLLTTNHCFSFREPNHDGIEEKAYLVCRANADGTIDQHLVEVMPACVRFA